MAIQTNTANWSADEMKQLTREIFDEDGEKMLTFGLFGRRSIDCTSPTFEAKYQSELSKSRALKPEYTNEIVPDPVTLFPDDSSGVTDVSVSVGSDSSYSNDSYNSYDGNKREGIQKKDISSPQPIQQYKEVCSLKYDPKIRCRCTSCKLKMTPKKVDIPQGAKRSINFAMNNVPIDSRLQNGHISSPINMTPVNGFNHQMYKPVTPVQTKESMMEEDISAIRRNTRRYRSYTPKSQKEMKYKTLQLQRGKNTEIKRPYTDDFDVSYNQANSYGGYKHNTHQHEEKFSNKSKIQEQTAGYHGDREGFESFPGKYFDAYSHLYSSDNTPVNRNDHDRMQRLQREYLLRDKNRNVGSPRENAEFTRELEQIQAEYQEIESRLKKEKFYRRSYIAAQEKDIPKVKGENVKLSVLYKQNGGFKENVKSPAVRSKSLTNTPISSPLSLQKEKGQSGRKTPVEKGNSSGRSTPSEKAASTGRSTPNEKTLNGNTPPSNARAKSPKGDEPVTSPMLRLLRTTSLRKNAKKREKLTRSKSFSEGEKKSAKTEEEEPKSPREPDLSSPCAPKEPPCVINVPPVRRKQIYHLDEEDSPEEGLRNVLDQMSKYQSENKAVPLFLNVIQDLRASYKKLLKESGKLKGEDPNNAPHDVIRRYSIPRKPSYSEAAKKTLDTSENKEDTTSPPVSPISGKIRMNGDELFYKVSLRKKSTDQVMDKSLTLNENGNTPIHRAATNGNLDILQILVLNGGDVNALNTEGWPALHLSLQSYHFRSALFLIEAGADLKDYTNRRIQEYHKVQKMARRYFQYLETEL